MEPNTVIRSTAVVITKQGSWRYRFTVTLENDKRFVFTGRNYSSEDAAYNAALKRRGKLIEKGYPK